MLSAAVWHTRTMSKRLQVLFDEEEYRHLEELAHRERVTLSEWVRRALREASAGEPSVEAGRKLEAVRAAVRHEFPTADLEQMIREIEQGYTPE